MYRINSVAQNKVEKFDLQKTTQLDQENRWVTTRAFPCAYRRRGVARQTS